MKGLFVRWRYYATAFFIATVLIFTRLAPRLDMQYFIGILFFLLYYLILLSMLLRIDFLVELHRLADGLGFDEDLHIFLTPKLIGMHKERRFKIEYWYKTSGKSPILARTYFKLFKEGKPGLSSSHAASGDIAGHKILALKEDPDYVILKLTGDVIDRKEALQAMDYMISACSPGRKSRRNSH